MSEQTLDISWEGIFKVFIAAFVFYVLFLIRGVIIWLFFALIISLLLEPVIKFLRWFKIPRIIAVAAAYLAIFFVVGLMVYVSTPIFIYELNKFQTHIPEYFEKINPILKEAGVSTAQNFEEFTSGIMGSLKESSEGILKAITVFFGGVSSTFVIFTFAFFISIEEAGVERVLSLMLPKRHEKSIIAIFERAQYQVAGWFGARVLACLFVGVSSFAVFFFLGVPYAFILALLSGVLTFVPFVGPMITAILAVLFIGASQSWTLAIYSLIALTVIQEIENKILTPLLMKKFLDLPPILVLVSLLVGEIMFGFLGMIFMVPVFGIAYEFLKEFLEKKKHGDEALALTE